MPPILVITIDTEEEGRWSSEYPSHGNTCLNIARLGRLNDIMRRLGAIPTYLVDYPVASDPKAREILAGFAAGNGCEIGAHLHPWCNPPYEGPIASPRISSYPHNLPPETQLAKLKLLCETIREGFGVPPTSYRAGRWGFDHTSIPVLERVGITVDTSVTPLWWDTGEGAPAFAGAPLRPYRLHRKDASRPGNSGVVEVPLSGLVPTGWGPAVERLVRLLGPLPGLRRLLVGMGFRSLRPEQFELQDMKSLADAVAARGLNVFNVMFHSSVALPGATPYVATEADLERFCERLEGILEHILHRHQAVPLPLSRVPEALGGAVLSGSDA